MRSPLTNHIFQPWIFTGWSYGGALAAWTAKLAPGTFWAYWASSGPVQLIDDFWQYFEPIKEGMPGNCSADFVKIFEYTDKVLLGGNKTEIKALKALFGLASLEHDDDFARSVFSQHPVCPAPDYSSMC